MDLGLSIGGSEARRREAVGKNHGRLTTRSGGGVGEWARPEDSNPPLQLELQLSWPIPRDDSPCHAGASAAPAAAAAEGRGAVGPPDQPAGDRENIHTDAGRPSPSTSRSTGGAGGWRCSDEEGGGGGGSEAAPRKKLRLTKEQSCYLEESFREHATLNPKQKLAIAKKMNLRPRQVEVWFQNRRARTKMKQTEVEYEYVKRCCESLAEENRRLRREIQELRALAVASPRLRLHPPPPAAALLMCPSCERAAGKEGGGRKAARSFGGAPLKLGEGCPPVAFPVS